ncbi:hypothetical protein CCP1ISM_1270002 [Azospirillaceae bacterium]
MPRRIPESDRTFVAAYGPALRQALTAKGYTGSTLARAVGMPEIQLQRTLRGEGMPPPQEMQDKIAAIVGPIVLNGSSTATVMHGVQDRLRQVVEIAKRDIAAAANPGTRPSQVSISIEL